VSALLELTGITKSFAGVQALKGVSFELRPGEVHALIGENGAGKSTLVKVITGAHRPDAGWMKMNGQEVSHNDPTTAKRLGVAVIYQQPALFPDLTVAENLTVGGYSRSRADEERNLERVFDLFPRLFPGG